MRQYNLETGTQVGNLKDKGGITNYWEKDGSLIHGLFMKKDAVEVLTPYRRKTTQKKKKIPGGLKTYRMNNKL